MNQKHATLRLHPLSWSFLGCLIAFLCAEAFCRLSGLGDSTQQPWRKWNVQKSTDESLLYKPGSSFSFQYSSNPRSYFDDHNAIHGKINENGFRGPLRTSSPPEGVKRFIMLGDSISFGTGVKDSDTLAALLEESLSQKQAVEVINLGLGGSDTRQQYHIYEKIGRSYQADAVILVAYPNDVVSDKELPRLQVPTPVPLHYSHLLHALYQSIRVYQVEQYLIRLFQEGFHPSSKSWIEMKEYIKKIRSRCLEDAIPLLVVWHPVLYKLDSRYPLQQQQVLVEEFCKQENIYCLDLFLALERKDYQSLWVHESDPHPNELANRLSAAAISPEITKRHLLSFHTP